MEFGTTIKATQATGPGEVPVLDENSLIPEAFIPKSASGGGGDLAGHRGARGFRDLAAYHG